MNLINFYFASASRIRNDIILYRNTCMSSIFMITVECCYIIINNNAYASGNPSSKAQQMK